jgi:hypothetical protein
MYWCCKQKNTRNLIIGAACYNILSPIGATGMEFCSGGHSSLSSSQSRHSSFPALPASCRSGFPIFPVIYAIYSFRSSQGNQIIVINIIGAAERCLFVGTSPINHAVPIGIGNMVFSRWQPKQNRKENSFPTSGTNTSHLTPSPLLSNKSLPLKFYICMYLSPGVNWCKKRRIILFRLRKNSHSLVFSDISFQVIASIYCRIIFSLVS